MRKYAIIVAGGEGKRMNHPVPKQFHVLAGKPVLYYSIDAFLRSYSDMQVILVLPESKVSAGQEIIDA
ncbi:MAG: 2-C-methyl-D-erythritol 4-phosphate cytidylyltransferase, partial [Sphingobacteriales bacterium]